MSGIDIVIATYNRPGSVPDLVETLERSATSVDRIFVVWQGTTRPSIGASRRTLLVSSDPPNLPAARNAGMRNGSNDIVLFLDDDVGPSDILLEAHRNSYDDPAVGAVAGYIEDPVFAPASQGSPSRFDLTTGECIQNFAVNQSGDAISVMGANMSFRRRALEAVGGFDPHYARNALWEEIDCAFRVRARQFRIVFNPAARVRHRREASGGCRSDRGVRYLFHQFANTAYFAGKFAPRSHLAGWTRFWWYRLEYLSRVNDMPPYRHSRRRVAAGVLGAVAGLTLYGALLARRSPWVRGVPTADRLPPVAEQIL